MLPQFVAYDNNIDSSIMIVNYGRNTFILQATVPAIVNYDRSTYIRFL
jgi:hypothetical protein